MVLTMQLSAPKVLGVSPKEMTTVLSKTQDRLFATFPRKRGENLKAWFPRVARELNTMARNAGWEGVTITPRRVRALWHLEARRIDAVEIRLFELAEQLLQLEQAAEKRRGVLNDIRNEIDALRSPDGGGNPVRAGGAPARDGRPGDGPGVGSRAPGKPQAAGSATEELMLALPTIKFLPRLH